MLRFRINRVLADALILGAIGIVLVGLFSWFDFYEKLTDLLARVDLFQVDELFSAVVICGLFGYIFAYRRFRDLHGEIRRRDKAEHDVNWISSHDMLTRLPNRNGLKAEVERLKAAGKDNAPFVAMAIDIDGFRHGTDIFGPELGDEVLVIVADRLRELFVDAYLFRLDGDRLFAAAEGLSDREWENRARRAIMMASAPVSAGNGEFEPVVSVVMTRYPNDAAFIGHLLRCALTAMAVAKEARDGAPRWFMRSMDEAATRRAELDKQLRRALLADEVRPYYQPMIDLTTRRIIGFEALARWQRADGSFVPPSDFIALAEETGLIGELSDRLFRRACLDAIGWPADVFLSFNISPAQLTDRLLAEKLISALSETGFPASRLELEITESVIVKDMAMASATVDELRRVGVHVAIDDFGTGYSSLSQLSRLRFDKLKIDRSFVASFEGDERQAKIIRAMIGLGRGLGMKTIAEGIEVASQAETLRLLGCQQGQGFLFGRAVTSEQALAMLAAAWPERESGLAS